MTACTADLTNSLFPFNGDDGTGNMVFFSSGTTENAVTRAPSTYYMPDTYRFVCRMYYKARTLSDDFDTSGATDKTAWLKVDGSVGNSLYWNKNFAPVAKPEVIGVGGLDEYHNDFSAPAFYWQNRKPHAFLAWTDLNHATELVGGETAGTLNMIGPFPYPVEVSKDSTAYYPCNAFDLTRKPERDANGNPRKDSNGNVIYDSNSLNSMTQQPDIVQALTLQAPTGATQESNRVNLYFRHQFAQVQVNIKNAADNSVALQASNILKVELLGVTEEGYVFTELDEKGKVRPTTYKKIDFTKYSEQQLQDNRYGTSFEMFPMDTPDYGFLKSFSCITYGELQAIRITWKEDDIKEEDVVTQVGIKHIATFRIPDAELIMLKSGMRYIWNIEIRRGALAVIRTEIIDWELPTDALHNGSTDGTIVN